MIAKKIKEKLTHRSYLYVYRIYTVYFLLFFQEWIDENLVWDPEDYGGLKMIRLPCDLIWLPDVVLYNR